MPCEQQLVDELRLSLVPGIGPLLRQALHDRFGSAAAVLVASEEDLRRVPGIGMKLSRAIATARDEIDVQNELNCCQEHGIQVLLYEQPDYPPLLREIPDPPAVLFAQGALSTQDQFAIAIVGTRNATAYGRRQAEKLAASLASRGITIVSGLARGIDAAAHRGALSVGGRTIAVLGSGLLNIYPPEHAELSRQIVQQGVLFSEFPSGMKPMSGAFPRRNRLMTGLSHGVIVVEASLRSGALISARHAAEQGREVFAVPGRIDSRCSQGCHRLLKEGARLVESADDVLDELGPLTDVRPAPDGSGLLHPAELTLNDQERHVLSVIEWQSTPIDHVVQQCELEVSRVLATLSALEIRGLIERQSGNMVIRR